MTGFEYEDKRHKEFFLPFYKERGWTVLEDNVGKKKAPYDVRLQNGNTIITVDEKAHKQVGDCIIELVQCIATKNWSWLYESKDQYLDACWEQEEQSGPPAILHLIDHKKLMAFICAKETWNARLLTLKFSTNGWGITLFATAPYAVLVARGIAKKIETSRHRDDSLENEEWYKRLVNARTIEEYDEWAAVNPPGV